MLRAAFTDPGIIPRASAAEISEYNLIKKMAKTPEVLPFLASFIGVMMMIYDHTPLVLKGITSYEDYKCTFDHVRNPFDAGSRSKNLKKALCSPEPIRGEKGGNKYEADLVLYGKLKGAERRKIETDRRIEFVIPKETEEWWPRLLKVSGKVPWIKIDFDKWKDQDEDDKDDMRDMDFSSFGLPGGGGKGYDDLDLGDDDHDYDDEMGDLEDVDDENEGIPKEGKKAEKDGKDEGKDSATNGELVDDGKEKKVVEEAKE
uniref:CS domain-containing protein n=1 Tax=Meloidogyne javanica TaxID=6303 RepID=A0A915LH59_MELJA